MNKAIVTNGPAWQWFGEEAVTDRQKDREYNVNYVIAALHEFNKTASETVPEYVVVNVLNGFNDVEVKTLAQGLARTDSLAAYLFPQMRVGLGQEWIPQVASIYHLDLYPDRDPQHLIVTLTSTLKAVDKLMRGPALYPSEWNKIAIQEPWKSARERVLRAWCTMQPETRVDNPLTSEVIALLSNNDREDHETLLEVIKLHPTATVKQIEHIVQGGSAAVSEGVL